MRLPILLCALALAAQGQVRISQVYGGGGNTGATLRQDFVELFNPGTTAVSLSGWSVQYASSAGTTWQVTPLSGSLAAGSYFLVRQAQGAGGTVDLPTADVTGTIAMSATAGKVLLVRTTTAQTGSCPSGALVEDLVGFGTATNCFEGAGPAPQLSNTTAALRSAGGCVDTNNNSADFSSAAPSPRNTASPSTTCSTGLAILTSAVLPPATLGIAYSQSFLASGGTGSYTWSQIGGTLPPGLTLTGNTLAGIPSTQGPYSFTLRVSSGLESAERGFQVNVGSGSSCSSTHTISQAQGTGSVSPVAGTATLEGIVTAVRSNGFYIQMPGSGDNNTATSDGILVFTSSAPPAAAAVGNLVCVTGTVTEFRPSADPNSPPLTEITSPTTLLLATGQTLPAPVTLTYSTCGAAGTLDVFECVEGMRVSIPQLNVVAPTDGFVSELNATSTSNGVFHGVLPSTARPFREAGIQAPDPLPLPGIPRFDGNPERIRVDSDAQTGTAAIDVATGAAVNGIVGVVDYAFRTYTVLPDPAPAPGLSGGMSVVPVPDPLGSEVTVGAFNLERFFDTVNDPGVSDPVLTAAAFANRLNKASLAIRNVLKLPDVLAVVEVENLSTAQALADRINSDAAGLNPGYTAYLVEGNDIGGIDVGFLVRSRVSVVSVTQIGGTAAFINPSGQTETLHDRPPLVLRATVTRPGSDSPLAFTVIANHLRSLNGIDDAADGPRVRAKRRAQAEWIANDLQARQAAGENVITVGDFNAFEVNDGYVDVIGTLLGSPAPPTEVTAASPDLVNPDYVNLITRLAPTERYSFVFDGNAQVLDHALVNTRLNARVSRFAFGRLNADFPEVLRSTSTRPERISDHDPLLAYITLPLEVTSRTSVVRSGYFWSRLNATMTGTVRITNTSGARIDGPIHLVLRNLAPAGLQLLNAAGTTVEGWPFVTLASGLDAGQTGTLSVSFRAPSPVSITYSPAVFSVNY